MHPVQRQLYIDHYHLQQLLQCLRYQLDCFADRGLGEPDLGLILDMLDYITVYPEHWHHPVEDELFVMLLRHPIAEAGIVEQTLAEHAELEKLTAELNRLFDAVAKDCVVSGDELVDKARHFMARQGIHIERENELIYPLFNRYLTAADWRRLEQRIQQEDDPLFGGQLKSSYDNLYNYVLACKGPLQPPFSKRSAS
ncbi:hypothetical protein FKG94_01965 [Exilibacterium tricleocarpae]|uniref:Hemerythrin-like domain-containing protein n=1 Tax=Exilibacterium tricleocarpae TaxID=2591008 RepID=A0A545U835_9GAMM|nr:hemerythrin domain-containing protein [Exilibacterium tricleocarpae]TQV85635.1 hypothetical protein FKG94_01965 [Exilibacterium tricleocarpae]